MNGKFVLILMIALLSMTACSDNGIGIEFGDIVNLVEGILPSGNGAEGNAPSGEERQGEPWVVVSPSQIRVAGTGDVYLYQDGVTIDTSNVSDGYVMVRYTGNAGRVVAQLIKGEDTYIFDINTGGRWEILPLPLGNGTYTLNILENIEGQVFALIVSTNIAVTLSNPLSPFLYPNQFVYFNTNSRAVALAAELAEGAIGELGVVANIYNYIITNIEYDFEKAAAIVEGRITSYVPDIDVTLATGKGICFDYASLMAAMLRAQLIPTRLEIGYVSGGIYHAWITVYTREHGWVGAAHFRGTDWTLMDPTFSAGQALDLADFIGDGTNYLTMFIY